MNTSKLILPIAQIWLLVVCLQSPLFGQPNKVPASDFQLSEIFQAPTNAPKTLSGLLGNIVVLEFWATWCAPCRTSMKHLDSIARKFSGKSVRFLAVSKESSSIVERYIKSHPSKLWIGIDATKEAHNRYSVDEIPHLVIIDKLGRLLAITISEQVTETRLNELLEGKDVWFEPVMSAEEFLRKESMLFEKMPLPKVVLKPFNARGGNEAIGKLFVPQNTGNSLEAITILPFLVHEAYQIPKSQIKIESQDLLRDRYYLHILLPNNNKQALRDTLKSLLTRMYIDISIDRGLEKEKFHALRRKMNTLEPQLSKAQNRELSWSDSSLIAIKQPVSSLITYLKNKYRIVDESGLQGEYDLSFSWNQEQNGSLEQALAELGLEIIESEKAIDIYVIKQKMNH